MEGKEQRETILCRVNLETCSLLVAAAYSLPASVFQAKFFLLILNHKVHMTELECILFYGRDYPKISCSLNI